LKHFFISGDYFLFISYRGGVLFDFGLNHSGILRLSRRLRKPVWHPGSGL